MQTKEEKLEYLAKTFKESRLRNYRDERERAVFIWSECRSKNIPIGRRIIGKFLDITPGVVSRAVTANLAGRELGVQGKPRYFKDWQEKLIADQVREYAVRGEPLTICQAIGLAEEMMVDLQGKSLTTGNLKVGGIGRGWFKGFCKRTGLKTQKGKLSEQQRYEVDRKEVTSYFNNLKDWLDQNDGALTRIINMDESGIQVTQPDKRRRVVIGEEQEEAYIFEKGYRKKMTMVAAISSSLEGLRPLFITTEKSLKRINFSAKTFPDILMVGSERGFITKAIFCQWVKEILIPWVEQDRHPKAAQLERYLLILDGHASRRVPELLGELEEKGIDVLILPAHSSHFLQPLDLSCFATFKTALKKRRHGVSIEEVLLDSYSAFQTATVYREIQSAFELAKIATIPMEPLEDKKIKKYLGSGNGTAYVRKTYRLGGKMISTRKIRMELLESISNVRQPKKKRRRGRKKKEPSQSSL